MIPPPSKSERAASKEYFQMIIVIGEEKTFLQIKEDDRWFSNEYIIERGVEMNESLHTIETTGKKKTQKVPAPAITKRTW